MMAPTLVRLAAETGLAVDALERHLEGVHGVDPGDERYDAYAAAAPRCFLGFCAVCVGPVDATTGRCA